MSKLNTKKHISVIINALKPLSNPFPKPLLIVMVGLPGTGKTYLARNIQESFPVTIIQSDQVRTLCFGQPKYTRSENKYVFEVALHANMLEIKSAIEEIFDVRVDAVRTMRMKGKVKRLGRFEGKRPDWKKAIVTLANGDTIDLFAGA